MKLSEEQRARYARHLSLPEIGEAGQKRLLAGRVLLVGTGGLGSPIALYLAAAGVGTIDIADDDAVDASNLQRQVLYTTDDLTAPKAATAAKRLTALNPDVTVNAHATRLTEANADELIPGHDIVIDATDNFATKFLIADACYRNGVPYSHAGIDKFFGQAMTVIPGRTACYRCLFDAPPRETGSEPPQGPLGAVPGVIGSLQACEVIKLLTGCGRLLTDRLFTYDALTAQVRIVPVSANPECRLCRHAISEPSLS